MIRVIITGRSEAGLFPYVVERFPAGGRSRQPLLDACRQLVALGVPDDAPIALYHSDAKAAPWSIRTKVGEGAKLTVEETRNGPKLKRYRPPAESAL